MISTYWQAKMYVFRATEARIKAMKESIVTMGQERTEISKKFNVISNKYDMNVDQHSYKRSKGSK